MTTRLFFPALLLGAVATAGAQVTGDVPAGKPVAIVDLGTRDGAGLVGGMWKYADARIIEVDHRAPGPDLKPTGPATRTYDIMPHAGAADFDDSAWQAVDATSLDARRS